MRRFLFCMALGLLLVSAVVGLYALVENYGAPALLGAPVPVFAAYFGFRALLR